MKPNCYQCLHRGTVPGSVHSSCHHPATVLVHESAVSQVAGLFGKRSGLTWIPTQAAKDLRIEFARQGIVNGWALWPANFDPVWLEHCDGFAPREQREDASS